MLEDDDTLQMYIEESYEHLEDIENDLLTIEKAGKDFDTELVNKVFRAAHSIKGGAGFVGLSNIKKLAHKIENVLGMMRGREISPQPEVISTILKAFDRLRFMIDDIENSETMDIDEYIVSLVAITTASLPDNQKESLSEMIDVSLPDGKKLMEAPQFDIDQAKKEGKFIYLVEYDLIHDIQRKNKSPLDVLKSIMNSGTIIQSMIDIQAVGTLDDDIPNRIPFYILFASVIEPEIITSLFDVNSKYVHNITSDMYAANSIQSEEEILDFEEKPSLIDDTTVKPGPEIKSKPDKSSDIPAESEVSIIQTRQSVAQASLRVSVSLLDLLMTLAGELVLSRNQLIQGLTSGNTRTLELSTQRVDMVTSELQEAIMKTRMQSIANVFNKFPRVVRDLASSLGKQVSILIEGKAVELDKTIIESISDPLTHLIRNSVDHGIEHPEERRKLGKKPTGQIKLNAFHEAGQVNIEVLDDGRGMDGEKLASSAVKAGLISKKQAGLMSRKEKIALIFLPGFSTAKDVTDLSGRGVGMDVVKTNLDRLGGIVDIESRPGKGTEIRIKLPLTLAIIPSQIISSGSERYAIPQVNLNELLRVSAAHIKERIEKVGDAEIVRLRGTLLPLLNLAKILGVKKTFTKSGDKKTYPDRRENIADRRSLTTPFFETDSDSEESSEKDIQADKEIIPRETGERRVSDSSALNIAVVSVGALKYGMIVDRLRDSEEIVVKPLGRHLKSCGGYAGATIMGDGKVALILDVAGLAQMADLTSLQGSDRIAEAELESEKAKKEASNKTSLLLFRNGEEEQFAVPLGLVERIEKIKVSDIEDVGGKKVIQYRGGSLPLSSLNEVTNVKQLPQMEELEVIVFTLSGKEIGLLVSPPVDSVDITVKIDTVTLKQPGIIGSSVINGYTTLMVDIFEAVKIFNPDWIAEEPVEDLAAQSLGDGIGTVLFAEDSEFFRNQVKGFLQDEGYRVIDAQDGEEALSLLDKHVDEIDIIVTDIEMPKVDGFEFAEKVKANKKYSHLKIIAMTSLAGDEDISRGIRAGIDDYQIKMNREKLIASINKYLGENNS
jgi:two-component system, chemotaxis family, sensor kinase CheA